MKKGNLSNQIGLNIKTRRKTFGIAQEEFGYMVGLTRHSIINIEAGRQSPTIERLLRICQILKCLPNDIIPLDYKFINPDRHEFKAIKLNAKSKHLQAKLDEVKRQQEEIMSMDNIRHPLG